MKNSDNRSPWTQLPTIGGLALAAMIGLGSHPLRAQAPIETYTITNVVQEEESETPPAIPETVVPARPDVFPTNPLESDTILSSRSTETRAEQVGSSVSVITGDSIRQAGFQNAADALRTVAGVNVVRQGNVGGLTSVFLRGANSQHTKVLLDGIPLNDPSSASRAFDFSLLSVDEIERIEIVRGPQSILYGSDAIGGVVNIVTRRGDGPTTVRASVEGGSYGTTRESVHVSGGGDRAYFSIGGSYLDTSGFSSASIANGNQESDGLEQGTFSGRFGWTAGDLLNVDYVIRYVDSDVEIDDYDFGTGLPIDNLIRRNLTEATWQRVQIQSLLMEGMIDQRVGLSISDYQRRDSDPGPFVPPVYSGISRTFDWQANILLAPSNVLTVGAEYYHEESQSSFQSLVSQNQSSFFIEDQFELGDRWFGTLGARWDDHNQAGAAETYRFTNRIPVYALDAAVHGSIGTGFRAPSLAENLFQFGNPNLRPEHSKGWDVGWQQRLLGGQLLFDATYFRNDFVDLIVFDFNTFSLQNVGRARSSGVELTGTWQPNDLWRIIAGYTFDDTQNLDTGSPLLRRPRNKTTVTFERSFACDRGVARLDLLFLDERADTGNVTLDSYSLVNASAQYRLTDTWSLYGRVDNLTDEDYEEINGYGVAGLSGYAGIEYRR